jgi:hypothetical protein
VPRADGAFRGQWLVRWQHAADRVNPGDVQHFLNSQRRHHVGQWRKPAGSSPRSAGRTPARSARLPALLPLRPSSLDGASAICPPRCRLLSEPLTIRSACAACRGLLPLPLSAALRGYALPDSTVCGLQRHQFCLHGMCCIVSLCALRSVRDGSRQFENEARGRAYTSRRMLAYLITCSRV